MEGKLVKRLDAYRLLLAEIARLLEEGRDPSASCVRSASNGSDEDVESFLSSGELWGGQGSISDSALSSNGFRRQALEKVLLALGTLQIESGKGGPRTRSWVAV